jgi:hypothetical protein
VIARKSGLRAGLIGAVALAAAVLSGCASPAPAGMSNASDASNAANAAAEANPNLDLGTSLGGQPAPDIRLENQDQPWLTLVSASGKIVWSHDGWVPESALEKAVAARY